MFHVVVYLGVFSKLLMRLHVIVQFSVHGFHRVMRVVL